MKSFSIISKFISFNPNKNELLIKFSFLGKEELKAIEDIYKEKRSINLGVTPLRQQSKTYKQLKRYYAMIKAILKGVGEPATSENVDALDEFFKETIFPKEEISSGLMDKINDISSRRIDSVKTITTKRNMSIRQLNDVMDKIEEMYSEIDFNKEIDEDYETI